LIRQRANA